MIKCPDIVIKWPSKIIEMILANIFGWCFRKSHGNMQNVASITSSSLPTSIKTIHFPCISYSPNCKQVLLLDSTSFSSKATHVIQGCNLTTNIWKRIYPQLLLMFHRSKPTLMVGSHGFLEWFFDGVMRRDAAQCPTARMPHARVEPKGERSLEEEEED